MIAKILILLSFTTLITSQCPNGHFNEPNNSGCSGKCDSTCYTCNGTAATNCLTCDTTGTGISKYFMDRNKTCL